jgi:hypothetical protein
LKIKGGVSECGDGDRQRREGDWEKRRRQWEKKDMFGLFVGRNYGKTVSPGVGAMTHFNILPLALYIYSI